MDGSQHLKAYKALYYTGLAEVLIIDIDGSK